MPLFRRRRHEPAASAAPELSGLSEWAATHGFQSVSGRVLDSKLEDRIQGASRAFYGFSRTRFAMGKTTVVPPMFFRSAYRGTVDGRQVTVANAWTPMEAPLDISAIVKTHGTSVVAVELPSVVLIEGIAPRLAHPAFAGTEVTTGDSAFDERYRVTGAGVFGPDVITEGVRQRIMARDDWAFTTDAYVFACVGNQPFANADDVAARVAEVLAVLAAIPSSVLPDHVDHSFDDLLARIDALNDVDEAIAFLQQLTPADRERLAQSKTPLALFADVQTPEAALARFESLDENQRLQILTMFMKVRDGQAGA